MLNRQPFVEIPTHSTTWFNPFGILEFLSSVICHERSRSSRNSACNVDEPLKLSKSTSCVFFFCFPLQWPHSSYGANVKNMQARSFLDEAKGCFSFTRGGRVAARMSCAACRRPLSSPCHIFLQPRRWRLQRLKRPAA